MGVVNRFVKAKAVCNFLVTWIAQQVADTKNTPDVTPLFSKGKEVAGTRPNTLINDRAPNFHTAFNKELYTNRWPRYRHINHIRLHFILHTIIRRNDI